MLFLQYYGARHSLNTEDTASASQLGLRRAVIYKVND